MCLPTRTSDYDDDDDDAGASSSSIISAFDMLSVFPLSSDTYYRCWGPPQTSGPKTKPGTETRVQHNVQQIYYLPKSGRLVSVGPSSPPAIQRAYSCFLQTTPRRDGQRNKPLSFGRLAVQSIPVINDTIYREGNKLWIAGQQQQMHTRTKQNTHTRVAPWIGLVLE